MQAGARGLARLGVTADQASWIGFGLGVAGAVGIAREQYLAGLALLLASRVFDGLDGALARLTAPTDRGAFLDITLDFLFYASVPLAFALANPSANALAAAVLLAAFIGTGSTFLAYAALAAQRGQKSVAYPTKGLYYLGGLTEASETIACFALMCLWPGQFATFAFGFAGLCALTTVTRLWAGWRGLPP
jgi:phosphatidylglycerophosphate synthase